MGKPKEANKVHEKTQSKKISYGGILKKKQQLKDFKDKKQIEKITSALHRRPSFKQCVPRGRWLEKEDIKIYPKEKEIHLSKDLVAEITSESRIFKRTPTKKLIEKAREELVKMDKRATVKRALFTRSLAVDLSFY